MIWETKKILADPEIIINPTTVRVPTCYGHAEAVHIKTKMPLSVMAARELLLQAEGVELLDADAYPTPFEHGTDSDLVYVGRLRQGLDQLDALNMWVVADNIRKGAALNAIQIAELLVQRYF